MVARLASSGAEASDEGAGGSSEEGAGRAPSSDRPLSSPATAKSSDPSLAAFVLNARQGPSAAVIATGVRRARVGGLRPQDLLLLLPPWLPGGEAPTISRSGGRVAPPPPLAGGRSRASRRDRTGPITNSRERDPENAGRHDDGGSSQRRGEAPEAAKHFCGAVCLFNIVATLPTISRFWQDTALTNHISEGPVLPLLQGNQYGTCRFEQGGELFDAIVVSKQGRVDEVA